MKNVKTLAFLFSCMLFLTVYSVTAQTAKTDFSGTWKFNEGKSQLGENANRRAASKIVITQDATSATIERTSTRQSGETVTTKEKYNLDGTESDNSTENRKKKSTTAWTNNDLTVNSTTTFDRNGNSMEMKSIEVFKLSADKSTLTIETTYSSQRGDFKTTLVYDLVK